MIKKFSEFIGEGWAAGSMKRAVGGNLRIENSMPYTKTELRDMIIKRIESEGNECDLNDIDVSRIKDMYALFIGMEKFNGHIEEWDVSNVKNMSYMFSGCTEFNQDISGWKVSNVKNMYFMFRGCTGFYEVDKLESWKERLNDHVIIGHMFDDCPVKPSWYK